MVIARVSETRPGSPECPSAKVRQAHTCLAVNESLRGPSAEPTSDIRCRQAIYPFLHRYAFFEVFFLQQPPSVSSAIKQTGTGRLGIFSFLGEEAPLPVESGCPRPAESLEIGTPPVAGARRSLLAFRPGPGSGSHKPGSPGTRPPEDPIHGSPSLVHLATLLEP